MEIKQHNTYIFKYQKSGFRFPFKGRVEEITETTYLISNLDTSTEFRSEKEDFDSDYRAVELVDDWHKTLEELIKTNPLSTPVDESPIFKQFTHPCWNRSCFCDGSCYRTPGTNWFDVTCQSSTGNILAGPVNTSSSCNLEKLKEQMNKINSQK